MTLLCWRCGVQTVSLSDRDHDATVARLGDIVTSGDDRIEFSAAGDRNRVAIYSVADKPISDSRGSGN